MYTSQGKLLEVVILNDRKGNGKNGSEAKSNGGKVWLGHSIHVNRWGINPIPFGSVFLQELKCFCSGGDREVRIAVTSNALVTLAAGCTGDKTFDQKVEVAIK